MAKDKDNEYEKTPTAGKGGSPASSTPNEEARGAADSDDDKDSANSRTPKESKENAGGKGGGLH